MKLNIKISNKNVTIYEGIVNNELNSGSVKNFIKSINLFTSTYDGNCSIILTQADENFEEFEPITINFTAGKIGVKITQVVKQITEIYFLCNDRDDLSKIEFKNELLKQLNVNEGIYSVMLLLHYYETMSLQTIKESINSYKAKAMQNKKDGIYIFDNIKTLLINE
jgi:hypothetical protein